MVCHKVQTIDSASGNGVRPAWLQKAVNSLAPAQYATVMEGTIPDSSSLSQIQAACHRTLHLVRDYWYTQVTEGSHGPIPCHVSLMGPWGSDEQEVVKVVKEVAHSSYIQASCHRIGHSRKDFWR